jgi:hypothetical protein
LTDERAPIPVNVLTGFLGSGKATVLRRLLSSPAFANTAVLINEFGEIGLDHLLIERLFDDSFWRLHRELRPVPGAVQRLHRQRADLAARRRPAL